jgi:hypothetical protein
LQRYEEARKAQNFLTNISPFSLPRKKACQK